MPRSDFAWVNFDHTFTAASPSADRTFQVEGLPVPASPPGQNVAATGYVLVQALDVENTAGGTESTHEISINGTALPSFDLPVEGGAWQTWMDRIPPGVLVPGANRIRITRGPAEDGFRVANVVVHWREQG
jgi:hypothetical protein